MGSEMKIEIPTTLIEDTIRAEMVRQIGGENKDRLIEAVVRTAMTQKEDNYSSTPTYFQQHVNEMIEGIAKEIFKEWIEQNRAAISKALLAFLNANKQKRLTEFAENLAKNINKFGIYVSLSFKDDNCDR